MTQCATTPAMEAEPLSHAAQIDAESVVLLPVMLNYYSHRDIGALGCVCRGWKERFLSKEDSWHALCENLAKEQGLYCPPTYAHGWRHYFWEHLMPARDKWDAQTEEGEPRVSAGFKIQVAVRFRPGRKARGSTFLLPLHQRLRLLKTGERITREEADGSGVSGDDIAELLAGADVSPDVLQAVLEAEQLSRLAAEVEHEARGGRARPKWVGIGEDWEAEGAEGDENRDGNVRRGNQGLHWASGHSAAGLRSRAQALRSGKDFENDEEEEEEVTLSVHRKGGSSQLLAAHHSRVIMYVPGVGLRDFHFGEVHSRGAEQDHVYAQSAHDSVIAALNGFNTCLLCYGQTGSGKTFTIFGPQGVMDKCKKAESSGMAPPTERGVALRAIAEVLEAAWGATAHPEVSTSVSCQYVEIYQDRLTDLVSGSKVILRDSTASQLSQQFVLQGAEEIEIQSMDDALEVLLTGEARKRYAATAMNHRSSRAHTILIVHITQVRNGTTVVKAQLNLVDLAGSEQLKQSGAEGQRKAEAVGINSSLLVLGKVIRSLVKGTPHVPYNESQLTQLLKGALGGNSRTTAVVTASMDYQHADQEQCSHITNRTRQAASSLSSALHAIDASLETCRGGIDSLEARGKTHLLSYAKLKERFNQLRNRRAALLLSTGPHEP